MLVASCRFLAMKKTCQGSRAEIDDSSEIHVLVREGRGNSATLCCRLLQAVQDEDGGCRIFFVFSNSVSFSGSHQDTTRLRVKLQMPRAVGALLR